MYQFYLYQIEALETEIAALRQVLESNENFSQGHSEKAKRNLTNPFRQVICPI